jgi:plasmid stabilization system protein ParE
MARYELSNAADRDLTDIYTYSYQQFGEAVADRYFSDLEVCFTRQSEFPRLGRSIDQIRPPV